MKCPKCGYDLPEDSEFCQYCGVKLAFMTEGEVHQKNTIAQRNVVRVLDSSPKTVKEFSNADVHCIPTATSLKYPQKFCKKCGAPVDAKTKKCLGCGKQYFRAKSTVPVFLLVMLLILSVGTNVYQYILSRDTVILIESLESTLASSESKINDQLSEISDLEGKITSKDRIISSQKSQIAELNEKGQFFDDICSALSSGNIGYAANNFNASESVIVVDKDSTDRKFTLTANWPNGGTVSTDYSSYAAWVDFDNDSWTTSTTMSVIPNKKGVTVVTFSNNVDTKTFKVIIIVTD